MESAEKGDQKAIEELESTLGTTFKKSSEFTTTGTKITGAIETARRREQEQEQLSRKFLGQERETGLQKIEKTTGRELSNIEEQKKISQLTFVQDQLPTLKYKREGGGFQVGFNLPDGKSFLEQAKNLKVFDKEQLKLPSYLYQL
jgi:hypothetical protein